MSRRMIIAGNWKMNKTHSEALELVKGLLDGVSEIGDNEMAIFPPSLYTREIAEMVKGSKIDFGVQNMYYKESGAYTGELSPIMVKETGSKYILIGHSERRHVFGETDEEVNLKVKAAFENNLEPMVCIGELLEEYEAGKSKEVNKNQTIAALKDITAEQMKKLVIAYEPVWAIGTGKVATPEIAEDIHKVVRSVITELYGEEIAQIVPILYGGSVKPDNAAGLLSQENIDGALVGGACLDADSFLAIAKSI